MNRRKTIGPEYTQQEKPGIKKHHSNLSQTNSMPIIHCKCGKEILLIPDLKAMNVAIEAHMTAHRKTIRKIVPKKESYAKLREGLIGQLFELSSQSNP